jgi:hypothetical protein
MLVLARRRAAALGTQLRLLVRCAHMLRVMKLHGVDVVMPVCRSLDEAPAGHAVTASGT